MSNINPNNISVTFPIAGQDNDSQGFRDNFNNIKTNLTTTKTELEDLQAKAVLKSALTGTTLSNDGAGSVLEDHELKDMSATMVNKGTLSGAVAVDFSAGHFQTVQSGATLELAFSNWPATTKYGTVTIEASADDMQELAKVLKLAGLTLPKDMNPDTDDTDQGEPEADVDDGSQPTMDFPQTDVNPNMSTDKAVLTSVIKDKLRDYLKNSRS